MPSDVRPGHRSQSQTSHHHLADTKAKKGPQGAHTAVIPAAEAARSLRVAKAKATLARFVRNQSTKAAKAASATIAAVLPAAEAARAQRVAKARTALARFVTEQPAKAAKTQARDNGTSVVAAVRSKRQPTKKPAPTRAEQSTAEVPATRTRGA